MIRSCKTSQMRFYTNPAAGSATVKWYFVPDGTPFVTFPTPFNNSDWDNEPRGGRTLGETDPSTRGAYYNGADTTNAAGTGPPCGTADQWLNGQPEPPAVPTPLNAYGVPSCCTGKASPFIMHNCPAAEPKGAYDTYSLFLFGVAAGDPSCPGFNGPFYPTYQGNCVWSDKQPRGQPPINIQLDCNVSRLFGSGWSIDFRISTNLQAVYHAPDPQDFTKPVTFTFNQSFGTCLNWPSSIILYPGRQAVPLIGSIEWDCGVDAIPAQYLLFDGRAVSRALYSLLFGRVGVAFGPGDGVTTFNLPDFRGKVPLGSGGSYSTGQAVGNDSPTLSVGQLPSHSHTITDPGHTHPPSLGNPAFEYTDGTAFAPGTGSGATVPNAHNSATGSATTGITIANTGSGNALDVRQAGLAIRPLIFAGQ